MPPDSTTADVDEQPPAYDWSPRLDLATRASVRSWHRGFDRTAHVTDDALDQYLADQFVCERRASAAEVRA